MEMTKKGRTAAVAVTSIVAVAIFALSLAITPVVLAATSGNDYPMEIIRAHADYKAVDPAATVVVGLGVQGNR